MDHKTDDAPRHTSGEYQSKDLLKQFRDMQQAVRFFQTKNWGLGFYFWLRVSLPILAFNLLFDSLNNTIAYRSIIAVFALVIELALLQNAGKKYAFQKYNIRILGSFCWSVYWRVILLLILYMIIVASVIAVFVSLGIEEALGLFVLPIAVYDEISAIVVVSILLLLSLMAIQISLLGVVVPRALEISYKKLYKEKSVWEESEESDKKEVISLEEHGSAPASKSDS